jgi:hypothetical protein
MVFDAVPAVEAGFFCLFYDLFEVTVIRIAKNLREIPARPLLVPGVIDTFNPFKRRIIAGRPLFRYVVIHN